MSEDRARRLDQLRQAYESGILDEDTYQAALAALGAEGPTQARVVGSGAAAQAGSVAAGAEGAAVGRDVGGHVVIAKEGARVFIGEQPVEMSAVDRRSALGRYLQHVISRNRYLQLQGIRSGGRLVHIELDQIYVSLRATRRRVVDAEERWLHQEAGLAPGEMRRGRERMGPATETVTVSVNEALKDYQKLVVLGDPGSGKTTLLRYLALLYARDFAEGTTLVQETLDIPDSGRLPIMLPLRQIGIFLRRLPEDGTEGHALLLDFLFRLLKNERIELPSDFFDEALLAGQAVILLDGLDEVAEPQLRRRVSRLVEAFTQAYSGCRYVVTSRIVGYTGSARLGIGYRTTTVRDFSMADVARFLTNWHRLVAIGQMGPGVSAEAYAAEQTQQLREAIEANERIRELAINPLMLTVIAMVHRDRVKLPDRRAELYAEAVEVLLGKWDEARGLAEIAILEGQPFDTGDRRLILQHLALHMQEQQLKEIPVLELRQWLGERFYDILGHWREVAKAVDRFLHVIEERTGLLAARGEGVYSFSHLTFQEYLAALAVAGRDDYVAYTLKHVPDPWWREVILLEVGYLSMQSRERTTRLIQAIVDLVNEPEPYHNLILAAECLHDVGGKRVESDLEGEIYRRLRADIEMDLQTEIERRRPAGWSGVWQRWRGEDSEEDVVRGITERKVEAAQALARIGGEAYWTQPYGEPEWVEIPAGAFWLGSERYDEERPLHKLHLDMFVTSRVPITNAQYYLFTQATNHKVPQHWEDNRPPKGFESHPVINVTWHDAITYCQWLSQATRKTVTLPSEAEWEKAGRGDKDQREYPWGDTFDPTRCNSTELGLGQTTPVGIFPNGASPYGCLDMAGNVWEWTRSIYQAYPYDPTDGREDLKAGDEAPWVLRGGLFNYGRRYVRCAARYWFNPIYRDYGIGFRVVLVGVPPSPLSSEPSGRAPVMASIIAR